MREIAEGSSQPLLTIITVNRDDHVGFSRTLASILEQHEFDSSDIEWLIVDSSANPALITDAIEREQLPLTTRVIWVEPAGIYPAMNVGLAHAQGRYVLFLNGGDRLATPDVFRLILGELNSANDSSLVWWVGRVQIVDRAGRTTTSASWDFTSEKRHMFARGVFPPHQATIVQTQTLLDLGGLDTSYSIASDYHAALRLSVIADPVVHDAVIAEFQEGGVSTTQWKRAAAEFHRARIEVFNPSFTSRIIEGWHTLVNGAAMLVYRDILRRDR